MYYADEREIELAAAERQMGWCCCSSLGLGRIISRAIKGGNNGRGKGRAKHKDNYFDYAMEYPPTQTYYVRPNARTTTVTTTNHHPAANNAHVHAVPPPEPTRTYDALPGAAGPPQPGAAGGTKPRKKKKKNRVTFTPETAGAPMMMPANAAPPRAGHAPQPWHATVSASSAGAGAAGSIYSHHHHGGVAEPYQQAPPVHHAYGGYGYGYGRYYAPSPLTRREVVGTPKRHEYFSGEYRWYYPTPVRESIYSFATDANHRLTNVFSEENPNACAIV